MCNFDIWQEQNNSNNHVVSESGCMTYVGGCDANILPTYIPSLSLKYSGSETEVQIRMA